MNLVLHETFIWDGKPSNVELKLVPSMGREFWRGVTGLLTITKDVWHSGRTTWSVQLDGPDNIVCSEHGTCVRNSTEADRALQDAISDVENQLKALKVWAHTTLACAIENIS